MWPLLAVACTRDAVDFAGESEPSGDTASPDSGSADTGSPETGSPETGGTGDTHASDDTGSPETGNGGDDTASPETGGPGDTGEPPADAGRRWDDGDLVYVGDDADVTFDGGAGYWIGAGDFDDDGALDLVTGESDTSNTWVYGGFSTGEARGLYIVSDEPAGWMGYFGAAPGDLTGDGMDDFVLGASAGGGMVIGGPLGGAWTVTRFASGSAFAGLDADGDGVRDVAIGNAAGDGVALYAGPLPTEGSLDGTEAATLAGDAGSSFGGVVAYVGDVDGDGLDDMAVHASGEGTSYVFAGPVEGAVVADDADVVLGGDVPFDGVFAGPADVDRDGYDDLVASARGARVFAGPLAGGELTDADAVAVFDLGVSVDAIVVLDFDGDGATDLVHGDASGSRSSYTYLRYGPVSGTYGLVDADVTLYDAGYYDSFGAAIVAADLDADGIDDLAFADGDTGGAGKAVYVLFGGL